MQEKSVLAEQGLTAESGIIPEFSEPKNGITMEDTKPLYTISVPQREDIEAGELEFEVKPDGRRRSLRPTKWAKYPKRYRKIWESDPSLKGWIVRMPDDDSRIICRFCQCIIRAHKSDLLKHMATYKHLKHEELYENGEEPSTLILPNNIENKKLKKKRLVGSDGSYIIVESEQALFEDDHLDLDDDMDAYAEEPAPRPYKKSFKFERRRKQSSATDMASKIGDFIRNDIEDLMMPQKPLSLLIREGPIHDPEKLKKMARICVAHLSRKYIFDSVCESSESPLPQGDSRKEVSQEIGALEKKFQDTLSEFRELKTTLDAGLDLQEYSETQ